MIHNISEYLANHGELYYTLLVINSALIVLAPWLIRSVLGRLRKEPRGEADLPENFWVNVLRGLNVLLIVMLGYLRFFLSNEVRGVTDNFGVKVVSILLVVYLSYLVANLFSWVMLRRFGKLIQTGSKHRYADSYASRILSLFGAVFISIIAVIGIVDIAGFGGLLEAGGAIGIIGVMLALTQGSWAPDIISGLIILNTKLLNERDVIRIQENGEELYAVVHRTRAFHTELLSLVDNHRLMMRNSRLRDQTVHNLSKFASAKGVRENLRFKLGHGLMPQEVRAMFNQAFELAQTEGLPIEFQHTLEIRLQDVGDHAVEWSIHYYTKDVSTLIATRQAFREQVLTAATAHSIDLSTPFTVSHSSTSIA